MEKELEGIGRSGELKERCEDEHQLSSRHLNLPGRSIGTLPKHAEIVRKAKEELVENRKG